MNIIKYITEERKEKGVGYTEFTKAMGISSQRFYQLMNQDDCIFGTARKMLAVLGEDFTIKKSDGSPTDAKTDELVTKMEGMNVMVNDAEAMIETLGLNLEIVDGADKTHDKTAESKG